MNTGDTAWVLAAAALVLFMTPGLAIFYGGMVRGKNVLGMLMQNFFAMGLIGVLWAIVGFSLTFGDSGGFIGDFQFAFMRDITQFDSSGAPVNEIPGLESLSIPTAAFFAFQMMFAIITPALITGATADRLKFRSYVLLIGLWSLLVYSPVAHWVFSPTGWLYERGALDFAGGTAIHINAGIASLVIVSLIGHRRGYPDQPMPPHSLPLTLLGTGILWFGWFGFNAGSASAANVQAAVALVNTGLAASAALLGWLVVERIKHGYATTLGAASGAVAGLVAITPCAGYVGGMSPIIIGAIAGMVCYLAIAIKKALNLDDSLDVIAVHLVGGIVGSLLLGFFADQSATGFGRDGVFFGGGGDLLLDQFIAVVCAIAYSGAATFVIAKAIDIVSGLRVDREAEQLGLDLSQHAETAYAS